jgi:DNA-binding Lrp family transcriptional regulator
MDDTDRQLIDLLTLNARTSTAALGRALGLSRSTVQDRLARLERTGAIAGYTVRLGDSAPRRGVSALVMMTVNAKLADRVVHALRKMPELTRLHSISGQYDLCATVSAVHRPLHQDGTVSPPRAAYFASSFALLILS